MILSKIHHGPKRAPAVSTILLFAFSIHLRMAIYDLSRIDYPVWTLQSELYQ